MNTTETTAGHGSLDAAKLSSLVMTALERTAFVMAEPVETESIEPDSFRFATKVTFTGAASGECLIAAGEGFVRELAAGFLGGDASEIDAALQGQDAMNELANIVAGMVIRELGNQTHRIFLGLPARAETMTVAPTLSASDAVVCSLDSCGEPLVVVVRLQSAIAKAA